jgi:hypothetical protein
VPHLFSFPSQINEEKDAASIERIKELWGEMLFQYLDALDDVNPAMAAEYA